MAAEFYKSARIAKLSQKIEVVLVGPQEDHMLDISYRLQQPLYIS